jgi:hypothetical protein
LHITIVTLETLRRFEAGRHETNAWGYKLTVKPLFGAAASEANEEDEYERSFSLMCESEETFELTEETLAALRELATAYEDSETKQYALSVLCNLSQRTDRASLVNDQVKLPFRACGPPR